VSSDHLVLVGRYHPGGDAARRSREAWPAHILGPWIEIDSEPGQAPEPTNPRSFDTDQRPFGSIAPGA